MEEQKDKETVNPSEENQEQQPEVSSQMSEEHPQAEPLAEASLEAALAEQKEKYIRLYADFENFRRRTAKEKTDFLLTANADLVKALLPIIDDFERALKALQQQQNPDLEATKEGIQLIASKFSKTLEQKGLQLMEVKAGDDFNSDLHEAITQIPAPSEALRGKIVDVVEKGYYLGEKPIRFAKVVIGQ